MQKLILFFSFLLISSGALAQRDTAAFTKFNSFNNAVLNGGIKKAEAQKQFDLVLKRISLLEMLRAELIQPKLQWVFPLKGYKSSVIGGTHGNGYFDKGYRYLDGNKHGAHPA
ncbi:hypothetical protein, partial [Mucilaginibacter sp.]|uniref:hypothetical protein n=1 Tax=Mucilaginibacter sp. TaxID=1882438 RepID=UPI002ED2ABE6